MVIWFSRGQLQVTDDRVRVGSRQYRIDSVHDVRLVRAGLGYANAIWGALTVAAVALLLDAALASAWRQDGPVLLVSIAVGVLSGIAVAQATRRRELWIMMADGSAMIWSGYDRIEGSKALRAVRRAHEHRRTANGEW